MTGRRYPMVIPTLVIDQTVFKLRVDARKYSIIGHDILDPMRSHCIRKPLTEEWNC